MKRVSGLVLGEYGMGRMNNEALTNPTMPVRLTAPLMQLRPSHQLRERPCQCGDHPELRQHNGHPLCRTMLRDS